MTVTLEIDERIHIRHRFGSISVTEHKIVYSVTSWQNVLDYASQQPTFTRAILAYNYREGVSVVRATIA